MTAPILDSAWDIERMAALRSARRRATGLLVLVAVGLVAVHLLTAQHGGWGYVQAALEAAVVGGMADWFAVTALFRHPLGVPIPHTAIIPRGKDAFGRGLGDFVARNFLDEASLVARLEEVDVAARLGAWLRKEQNAASAAAQLARFLTGAAEALGPEDVQDSVRSAVEAGLDRLDAAGLFGSIIEQGVQGGHHTAIVDASLLGIARLVDENQDLLRELIRKESPWWVPEPVDERVFRRVHSAIRRFVDEVTADPNHYVRKRLDDQVLAVAADLRTSPELRARAESLKQRLLESPRFQEWVDGIWVDLRSHLARSADEPDSDLRIRLEAWSIRLGHHITSDQATRERINRATTALARRVVVGSAEEVRRAIGKTVAAWDAEETSRRLELLLGRDLQFIRINGTIVGGLVGLVIHAITELA